MGDVLRGQRGGDGLADVGGGARRGAARVGFAARLGALALAALLAACGSSGEPGDGDAASGGAAVGTGGATPGTGGVGQDGTGGSPGTGGGVSTGGAEGTGGATGTGGQASATGGGDPGPVEPPGEECEPPIALADVSSPTTVVGDGSPASCTHEALAAAVAAGGIITFACGDDPVTIDVTAAYELRTDVDTVVDGGGLVTLDGGRLAGRMTRIFEFDAGNYRTSETTVTLQRLTLQNAEAPRGPYLDPDPGNPICARGYADGGGGAIEMRDGRLHVVDCVFRGNRASPSGPDVGGGAIYSLGSREVIVVGSTFLDNEGSNSGAVGLLQTDGIFYNTVFEDNHATGTGANSAVDASEGCDGIGHPNQSGSGGNGAAIAIDGDSVERAEFCGVVFRGNTAGELGTVFRTPNSLRRPLSFDRCWFDENETGGGGAVYAQDVDLDITASAFTGNVSSGNGGALMIAQGPWGTVLTITNTTFAGNVSTGGLGGAIAYAGPGEIRNVTFAGNECTLAVEEPPAYGQGAAIVAQDWSSPALGPLTIANTVFVDNQTRHPWTSNACKYTGDDTFPNPTGTGNVQWPTTRYGDSQLDDPCTPDITWADPGLGAVGDNGGPTPTLLPTAGGAADGIGDACPPFDQRGEPRPASGCTAGAVELGAL